jgi:hypothetical protein
MIRASASTRVPPTERRRQLGAGWFLWCEVGDWELAVLAGHEHGLVVGQEGGAHASHLSAASLNAPLNASDLSRMASVRSGYVFFARSASKLAKKSASFGGGVLANAASPAGRADGPSRRLVAMAPGFCTMD